MENQTNSITYYAKRALLATVAIATLATGTYTTNAHAEETNVTETPQVVIPDETHFVDTWVDEMTKTPFFYKTKSDGTLKITGINVPRSQDGTPKFALSEESIIIPSSINGKTVTEIASRAFAPDADRTKNRTMYSVIQLPSSVKIIGANAFPKNAIVDVPKTNSITTIGSYAFGQSTIRGAKNATTVNFTNLKTVNAYAFSGATFELGVSFNFNTATKNVKLGQYAFYKAKFLRNPWEKESITFGKNITATSKGLFARAELGKNITFSGNVTDLMYHTFYKAHTTNRSVVTMSHVATVRSYAFSRANLESGSMKIGNIKTVERKAFFNTTIDEVVTLKNVKLMKTYAVYNTTKNASGKINMTNLKKNEPSVIYGKNKTYMDYTLDNSVVSKHLISPKNAQFRGITIFESNIKARAFEHVKLSGVILFFKTNKRTTIGDYAFYDVRTMGVTFYLGNERNTDNMFNTIGKNAFYKVYTTGAHYQSLTLPKGTKKIGKNAFNTRNITKYYITTSEKNKYPRSVFNAKSTIKLY